MGSMLTAAAATAALAASLAFAVVFDGPVDKDTCQTPACLRGGCSGHDRAIRQRAQGRSGKNLLKPCWGRGFTW